MGRKINSPEQIVRKLREAEVLVSQGNTISQASRQLGITEQTYYRWRKLYGGMQVSQAKRLKDLENENNRLKKLVADLSWDKAMVLDCGIDLYTNKVYLCSLDRRGRLFIIIL